MPNIRNVEDSKRWGAWVGRLSGGDIHEKWRAPENLSIFCRTTFKSWNRNAHTCIHVKSTRNDDGASGPASRPKGRPVAENMVEDAVRCVCFTCHTTAAKLTWWNLSTWEDKILRIICTNSFFSSVLSLQQQVIVNDVVDHSHSNYNTSVNQTISFRFPMNRLNLDSSIDKKSSLLWRPNFIPTSENYFQFVSCRLMAVYKITTNHILLLTHQTHSWHTLDDFLTCICWAIVSGCHNGLDSPHSWLIRPGIMLKKYQG